MRRVVVIILGLVLIAWALPALAADPPTEKVVEAKAQKARGGGADENIKQESVTNDPAVKTPPPANKGGEATRGQLCGVWLDNYTPWYIKFYVDGIYWGTSAPWGEVSGLAFAGATRVYARADFLDGSAFTWGPQVFYCERDEVYRWKVK